MKAFKTKFKFLDDSRFQSYSAQVYDSIPNGKENISCLSGNIAPITSVDFKWTHESTKLLLDIRLNKEKDFNRPLCKKKKLWTSVAEEMQKIGHYMVTGEMCDIKYRNLLATYKTNKKKKEQSGESSITWEYFNQFDTILGEKACIAPPKEMLGATLLINATSASSTSFEEGCSGKNYIFKVTLSLFSYQVCTE